MGYHVSQHRLAAEATNAFDSAWVGPAGIQYEHTIHSRSGRLVAKLVYGHGLPIELKTVILGFETQQKVPAGILDSVAGEIE